METGPLFGVQKGPLEIAVDRREDDDEPEKPAPLCPARLAAMRRLGSVDKPTTTEDRRMARVMATLIERADAGLCDAEGAAELVVDFLFAADLLYRVTRLG